MEFFCVKIFNMQKIIVVSCLSTHLNLIDDIRNAGYEPIVFEPLAMCKYDEMENGNGIYGLDAKYQIFGIKKPIVVNLHSRYNEILDFARSLKPAFVIPGGDTGIYLATKLANDLKLPCNPFSIFPNMRNKNAQQMALKKAGLRYIKSFVVHSLDEALKIYKKLGAKKVVVKPNEDSGSSNNVFICQNKKEFEVAIKQNLVVAGLTKGALIQEYINGEECVVNIVVSKENKIISSAMVYKKIFVPGFTKIYDLACFISPKTRGMGKVVKYAQDVVKALNIQYGTVHSEFMIDEKGPVLIEANCRVTGPSLRASFLDKFLPHHETDLNLKSFIDPKYFARNNGKIFEPTGYSTLKFIIVPQECFVKKEKLHTALKDLKSYNYSAGMGNNKNYPKTVDLLTCGGIIYLTHKNKEQLDKDVAYIEDLERNHFEKLFDCTLTSEQK